jgi:hypothetical protein
MKCNHILAALLTAAAMPVFAQATADTVQRNVNQQARIEQGLQSGQLNTKEAGRLELEQARIEGAEARALGDGKMGPKETARITQMQNQASRDIAREKHDAQTGNPNSASSQRMQADVQRNINQEQRIQQGMASGQLTNREASRLEAGQAHVDRVEARAGRDGHVGAGEQAHIQHSENVQSRRIYRQKHDAQTK